MQIAIVSARAVVRGLIDINSSEVQPFYFSVIRYRCVPIKYSLILLWVTGDHELCSCSVEEVTANPDMKCMRIEFVEPRSG